MKKDIWKQNAKSEYLSFNKPGLGTKTKTLSELKKASTKIHMLSLNVIVKFKMTAQYTSMFSQNMDIDFF